MRLPVNQSGLYGLLLLFFTACSPPTSMTPYALRLRPGQDLKAELIRFTQENQLQAGIVLTCVGSLTEAGIRLANQDSATRYEGHFEIVSLTGTLAPDGVHLHIAIADSTGRCIGGHLMDGCRIYTTAEIALGELGAYRFTREVDPTYGYQELKVVRR
ncbi:MAG: PPC domain-containing DNA-binding protein [Bacteroidia bacterium]|nr:PPC domain-containing DNA-binding protein [Bacteroidia bacterium]